MSDFIIVLSKFRSAQFEALEETEAPKLKHVGI